MLVYDQAYSVELSFWDECPACGEAALGAC
jgi:hypothetical protein